MWAVSDLFEPSVPEILPLELPLPLGRPLPGIGEREPSVAPLTAGFPEKQAPQEDQADAQPTEPEREEAAEDVDDGSFEGTDEEAEWDAIWEEWSAEWWRILSGAWQAEFLDVLEDEEDGDWDPYDDEDNDFDEDLN